MIGKANNADSRPSTLGIYANSSMYGSVIPSVFGRTRSPLSPAHATGTHARVRAVRRVPRPTPLPAARRAAW